MQMEQESRAVRCGNSPPQGNTICGGGFRLFNLAGLIWPLSMDSFHPLSPSLLLFFFSLAREDAHRDSRPWFMPKSAPFIISLSPSPLRLPNHSWHCWMCACVKLETQTSVHANLTRPSVRHSTLWPTKKEVPYLPSSPLSCHSLFYRQQPVSRSRILRGWKEASYRKSDVGCFGQCWIYLQLVKWHQDL